MTMIEATPPLESGYVRCEYNAIVTTTMAETNRQGAHLVDFGDIRHWIPKKLCKFNETRKIDIVEWKYIELGL